MNRREIHSITTENDADSQMDPACRPGLHRFLLVVEVRAKKGKLFLFSPRSLRHFPTFSTYILRKNVETGYLNRSTFDLQGKADHLLTPHYFHLKINA